MGATKLIDNKNSRSVSKANEAYNRIKQSLIKGEFASGERLTEARLTKHLGLGRNPIRESLLRLESEGLIEGRGAYGGKYVGEFIEDSDPEEVLYRYELRGVIEGLAARLAAKHMAGWQIDELRRLHDYERKLQKKKDSEGATAASIACYRYMLNNCGNPLLIRVWEMFRLQPKSARSQELKSKIYANLADVEPELDPLEEVIEAIATFDADKADWSRVRRIRRITEAIRKTMREEGALAINSSS